VKQPNTTGTTEPVTEEASPPPRKACEHSIDIPVYEGTWIRYWRCRCGLHKAWGDAMT
jgi:hypothetical protein